MLAQFSCNGTNELSGKMSSEVTDTSLSWVHWLESYLGLPRHPFVALMVSGKLTSNWPLGFLCSDLIGCHNGIFKWNPGLALRRSCPLLRPECPQPFPSLPGAPHQHPNLSHTGALGIASVSKGSRGTVITPHNFLILPSTFFIMSAPSSLSALL